VRDVRLPGPGARGSLHLTLVSTTNEGVAGPSALTVSIERTESAVIVEVAGEVDLSTAPRLKEVLDEVAPVSGAVIVDLTGVSFMDSSGLNVLLQRREQLLGDHSGATVRLIVTQPSLRRLFEVTGLNDVFELFLSSAEATGRH